MTFQHTFRAIAGIAAVALAMAFGSGAALAQPLGGQPSPWRWHSAPAPRWRNPSAARMVQAGATR